MKEMLATARNLMISIDEDGGTLNPMAEIVLILTEPQFSCDAAGSLVRTRTTEMVRFSTSSKGLRGLAKRCSEWADELDTAAKLLIAVDPEIAPKGKGKGGKAHQPTATPEV